MYKFDCSSMLNMAIATTIAFSYQINFATAQLDEDTTTKIEKRSIAPSTIHARNPPTKPNNLVLTPTDPNPIIEQRETTDSAEKPDLNLLKKAVRTFYQSNRVQSKSNMTFDFSSAGMKGQIDVKTTTVAETGGKFNSQVVFVNPQSKPIQFNIVSNGQKVWVYRPDKRVYQETSIAKFEKERFWVGMSAAWISMITEKDRLRLLNDPDSTFDSNLSTALKAPQLKDFKGERVLVDDRFLYAFSSLLIGNIKFTGFVQPDTGAIAQFEMNVTVDGMKVILREKIESWQPITSIDKKTFTFSPPKGVKRVKILSIMPFGK
jgi:outer membrane lipoprotein-sorting protein